MDENKNNTAEKSKNKISDTILFFYEDAEGNKSKRAVNVQLIEKNQDNDLYMEGYCSIARARRAFRLDRIHEPITRQETGEILSVADWLEQITGEKPDFEVLERKAVKLPQKKQPVTGKGVLFTGFKADHRKELEELVIQAGWHVRKSISPTVDILVTGYNAGPKKIQEAIKAGAKVFLEADFLKAIEE